VTSDQGDDRVGLKPADGDGDHDDVQGGADRRSELVGQSDPGEAPRAPETFIGPRGPRWRVESVVVRIVATSGIVGISVALAAILGTQDVAYWIVGLVVALVSVILAAVLWSSRTL
jgi:hypothetical protein